MCEDCLTIKEIENEKELLEIEHYYEIEYYKKRMIQLKKQLDEANKKLKAIEETLNIKRKEF